MLEELFVAGVSVSLEEVKGKRQVVRPGLEISVEASDFDNPLATCHWKATTGGSTGSPQRLSADFDGLEADTAYYRLCLEAFDGLDRPGGLWLMAPPGMASLQQLFRSLKIGEGLERWWTPTPLSWHGPSARYAAFTALTVALARHAGKRVPYPLHLPAESAVVAARWLAESASRARPAVLSCTASAAAR